MQMTKSEIAIDQFLSKLERFLDNMLRKLGW